MVAQFESISSVNTMRAWCNGSMPSFQDGEPGSIPGVRRSKQFTSRTSRVDDDRVVVHAVPSFASALNLFTNLRTRRSGCGYERKETI